MDLNMELTTTRRASKSAPRAAQVAALVVAALVVAAAACTTGCIARSLTVESTPPGAEVRLNGQAVGVTPVRVPFRHYGVYRVELRKSGYEVLEAEEPVLAPWFARFPACLVAELLPARIPSEHYLSYELAEPRTPERAGLLERAEAAAGSIP